jgi:hypothetical protein
MVPSVNVSELLCVEVRSSVDVVALCTVSKFVVIV